MIDVFGIIALGTVCFVFGMLTIWAVGASGREFSRHEGWIEGYNAGSHDGRYGQLVACSQSGCPGAKDALQRVAAMTATIVAMNEQLDEIENLPTTERETEG